MNEAMFKLCIFGDGGVGKTTLINRYMTGAFKNSSSMTIGVDFYLKELKLHKRTIILQIWDFAGESRFRFLLPSYLLGAFGGIFMYDITRYNSLISIVDWFEVVKRVIKSEKDQFPIIMVGGKLDLEEKRAVSTEEAIKMFEKQNLRDFIECSSKTGQNINDIFVKIAELMMEKAGII